MVAQNEMLQPRWVELKDQVKNRWSKLSDDDVANLTGSQEQLVNTLREYYGYAPGQALMEIQRWITDFDKDNPRPRK